MGWGVLLWYAASVLANLVTARDDQAKILRVSVTAALLGIPLCVLGAYAGDRLWHNGATGAMASDVLLELYLVISYLRMLPSDMFSRGNVSVLARAALAALPMVYCLHGLPASRFKPGAAALALLVYALMCWLLRCFGARDLALLADVFARKTGLGNAPRRLRVLLVSPYYSPGVGGAPRLLQSIVDYLNSRGHSVEALAFGAPVNNDCPAFDRQQSYPIYRIPGDRADEKAILLMGLRLLALTCTRRYDLIFCGTAYPSVILARAVSGLFPIPYLVYAHGEDASPIKNTRVKRFLLSHALRGASDLLVNSRFTRGEIADFGVELSRIAVVPPGIDPAPYGEVAPEEVAALRRRLGLEGKRIILTVARLTERKGHDMIVRSLRAVRAAVPNAHYLIVGKGDTSALQALADAEGVADGISIIPYIAEADLFALYHLCDVYAMVSRYDPVTLEVEGFGIVYLEAGRLRQAVCRSSHGAPGTRFRTRPPALWWTRPTRSRSPTRSSLCCRTRP